MGIIIFLIVVVAIVLFGRYFVVPRLPKIAEWFDNILNKNNDDEDNSLY